jgi:hypothetical protein
MRNEGGQRQSDGTPTKRGCGRSLSQFRQDAGSWRVCGQKAKEAGLEPGKPIVLKSFKEDRPR